MSRKALMKRVSGLVPIVAICVAMMSAGCETYPFLPFADANLTSSGGDTGGTPADPNSAGGGGSATGDSFTEHIVVDRTFTDGTSVTTVTYNVGDLNRSKLLVDFNADGRTDPVVGYGEDQRTVQILLSQDPAGSENGVEFLSLTLDGDLWDEIADVAAGDIDGDGALDIVIASANGVFYMHHPTGRPVTDLRYWGMGSPEVASEVIFGTDEGLSDDEIQSIIAATIGPAVNIDDYVITVRQGYTSVEIGDMDNDGDNDIVASRTLQIDMQPKPDREVPPIQIIEGTLQVLVNPGFAVDGLGWETVAVGEHERLPVLDRDVPSRLMLMDMDRDGDLDIVSAARRDVNSQVAWFENPLPGGAVDPDTPWTQWRVGSVRDAWSLDIFDLTGDGWPDVVAVGGEQRQMVLFENPGGSSTGIYREYDWDTHAIVTFETFDPFEVKVVDIDVDGQMELLVSGTVGAVRYYEAGGDVRQPWEGAFVLDFTFEGEPAGTITGLAVADLDGDGDPDIIAVQNQEQDNAERISWIENELP